MSRLQTVGSQDRPGAYWATFDGGWSDERRAAAMATCPIEEAQAVVASGGDTQKLEEAVVARIAATSTYEVDQAVKSLINLVTAMGDTPRAEWKSVLRAQWVAADGADCDARRHIKALNI